ncbi:MAG: hypothetical protein LBU91_02200 [Bacteroidales bacterium]|nr:hypothetical protein [Bacteroidales bacterium]
MKRAIVLTGFILGTCLLFGQDTVQINIPENHKKQFVSLSFSPFSLSLQTLQIYLPFAYSSFNVVQGEFGVKGVVYEPHNSGLFTIVFGRTVKERLDLIVNLSYQQFWREWDLYVDAHSPHYYTERFHYFHVLPEVRYNYYQKKGVSLFLSGGVGIDYFRNAPGRYSDVIDTINSIGFAYQLWLFGIQVEPQKAKGLSFRTAVGFGARGAIEFGLGYRF